MTKNTNYSSNRQVVYARNGMVATSEPQAAQAGLDILRKGGNAIDAAIAVAATLTVVEPTSNGLGGDNFSIISYQGELYGLNSSGFAPKSLTLEKIKQKGYTEMPKYGFEPITVPGAVKGWAELSKRFGKLPFAEVLKPAITYATEGFVVSETVAKYWQSAAKIYERALVGDAFKPWFDTFLVDGKAPIAGQTWFFLDHGKTLLDISLTEGKSFYEGQIALEIDTFMQKHGGYLSKEDLIDFQAEWVEPIMSTYRDHEIYELPPNGQGAVALMALNILENFKLSEKETTRSYHLQMEAMKLAFADGLHYISDPKTMNVSVEALLDKHYAKLRSRLIKGDALAPVVGKPSSSGTVYLATADSDGNMVSLIQSNYMGFGSGIVIPNTGISLHNRGHNFSIDPRSPNVLSPLKRPYHTIIPGFIIKKGEFMGPFGVMGGFMQPQGHLQVITNMIDFDLNPQQALDAPRWQWIEGKKFTVEPNFDVDILNELIKKGHDVTIDSNFGSFGRGQIILKDLVLKTYKGGTEKRADGTIACY
jgi:gamma-glutamyltranspeptidase / glutathione hydrolase